MSLCVSHKGLMVQVGGNCLVIRFCQQNAKPGGRFFSCCWRLLRLYVVKCQLCVLPTIAAGSMTHHIKASGELNARQGSPIDQTRRDAHPGHPKLWLRCQKGGVLWHLETKSWLTIVCHVDGSCLQESCISEYA